MPTCLKAFHLLCTFSEWQRHPHTIWCLYLVVSRTQFANTRRLHQETWCFYTFSVLLNIIGIYICTLSILSELNRCQLDLSELNRLVLRLQAMEAGQAFTNGDMQRIISMQVGWSWVYFALFYFTWEHLSRDTIVQNRKDIDLYYGNDII